MAEVGGKKLNIPGISILKTSDFPNHNELVKAMLSANAPTILDGAHDLGFMSDRMMVMPGGNSDSKLDPEAALNAHEPPVLTQGMFVKALRHQANPVGMREPGNLDPYNRPSLKNADGSISTTRSFSIGTDRGETLIPQVIGGKLFSQQDAIAHFRKTGEHFGIFDTPANADSYAMWMHNQQADRMGLTR